MAATLTSRGQQRDKPYRDALRMEKTAVENGEACLAPRGSLRWIARQQLLKAGEDTAAAKEIADRLDGKVPQAIVGDDEAAAIAVKHTIEQHIVDAPLIEQDRVIVIGPKDSG